MFIINDINDVNILHHNRLPSRAFVQKENVISLNGKWNFKFYDSPLRIPPNVFDTAIYPSHWDSIDVPSCWQLKGYGHMHYTDLYYPFPATPPLIPSNNPTGVYHRTFNMIDDWLDERVLLRFYGVDSAFHVLINNHVVGYSQGSRMVSEFDITPYLSSGSNTITVSVYQYCTDTYLEDQDMWWLSGIFRDVEIEKLPKISIWDCKVDTELCNDYIDSNLTLQMTLLNKMHTHNNPNNYQLNVYLDHEKIFTKALQLNRESEQIKLDTSIKNPKKWHAEEPNLYTLKISLLDSSNKVIDEISQKIGFRTIEIHDGKFLINGRQIFFKGVNRHDFNCDTGRYVTHEDMEKDILLMKRNNINAVRTSHYPNMPYFYDLCDKYGLYVIAEADLECNGFQFSSNYSQLSDNPDWALSYVDRIERCVGRDKNHPSIIMWSLGNEASYGRNFVTMANRCKEIDATRPIHYEEDGATEVSDVYSTMYTRLHTLEEIGRNNEGTKPHILCEYGHAMGNGPGGLKEHMDVFEKYERLHGGFIWEWIDHGIRCYHGDGTAYFKHGGDYASPHNGNFNCDGLLFPDRTPSPALYEYKKVIEPIVIECTNILKGEFIIKNKFDFISLDDFIIKWQVKTHGKQIINGDFKVSHVFSKHTEPFKIHYHGLEFKPLTYIHFSVQLAKDTEWAPVGYEVAFAQFELPVEAKAIDPHVYSTSPVVLQTHDSLTIKTKVFEALFDKVTGRISSYKYNDHKLILDGPGLNFWRPPIDNDLYVVTDWKEKYFLHLMKESVRDFQWIVNDDKVTVISKVIIGSANQEWYYKCSYTYSIYPDGLISLRVTGYPYDPKAVAVKMMLPKIGLTMKVHPSLNNVTWFGRGPLENYPDSKLSQRFDLYHKTIDELYTPYVVPQENGNRSDIQFVTLRDDDAQLSFTGNKLFNFSSRYYTDETIEKANHTIDLIKSDFITLHIDYLHNGLGSNSCGEEQLPPYKLKLRNFDFTINFSGKEVPSGD